MATQADHDKADADYLKGDKQPVSGSLLISNSRYLNNPLFRDLYAQMGLKRDGWDLPAAYLVPEINAAIMQEIDYGDLLSLIAAEREKNAEFDAWLSEGFLSDWKAEDVADCKPGTLGAAIHSFLADSGMEIDFMFRGAPADDYTYINKRRVQNHDIEHMVTGLDPSPVGETALIVANTVAVHNYFSEELAHPMSLNGMFLTSTSIMRAACHYPAVVPAMLEGIARGQAMGEKQEKPLFMIRWEDHVDRPIAELREEFGFTDGPADGHWEWTHDASRG